MFNTVPSLADVIILVLSASRYLTALLSLLMLASITGRSQSFEEYKKKVQAEFKQYKEKTESDFRAYRNKVNAEMEEYIRRSWVQIGREPLPKESPIKDDEISPTVVPDGNHEEKQIVPETILETPAPAPAPEPVVPFEETPVPVESKIEISFYGTPISVRFDVGRKPTMKDSSEASVADMWNYLCNERYDNFYYDCNLQRSVLNLCDWAYFKFAEAVAEKVYGSGNKRESVVLQYIILLQSGYKLAMGRADDSTLHLLLASPVYIDGCGWFSIDNKNYFNVDGSQYDKMCVMFANPDGTRELRLMMAGENDFTERLSSPRNLSLKNYPDVKASVRVNENLISFYNDYPIAYEEENGPLSRWRFYAQTPMSAAARNSLYPSLKKAIEGKSELAAANVLLNFVQTAFVYKYDEEIWGYDRSFFSEESLYYPYCDCEDRSILFSRIVRDLLGLKVVLVYYPGHLAAAVRFNRDVNGDYLLFKGEKYTICEATCLDGCPVGITGNGLDNTKATVVEL